MLLDAPAPFIGFSNKCYRCVFTCWSIGHWLCMWFPCFFPGFFCNTMLQSIHVLVYLYNYIICNVQISYCNISINFPIAKSVSCRTYYATAYFHQAEHLANAFILVNVVILEITKMTMVSVPNLCSFPLLDFYCYLQVLCSTLVQMLHQMNQLDVTPSESTYTLNHCIQVN